MAHPGGRPPAFNSPEQMSIMVDSYFQECDEHCITFETKDKDGNTTTHKEPRPVKYTMTGLALRIGFVSRQSLYDYAKKEEFAYIIKKAILRIENQVETEVRSCDKPAGAIFVLKNMGWSDKSEIEHKGLREPPRELIIQVVE